MKKSKNILAITMALCIVVVSFSGCTGTSTKMDDTKISDSFSEAFGGFDLNIPTKSPEQIPTQTPTQTQEPTNSIDDAFEKLKNDLISKYGQVNYTSKSTAFVNYDSIKTNWTGYKGLISLIKYDLNDDGNDEATAFLIDISSKDYKPMIIIIKLFSYNGESYIELDTKEMEISESFDVDDTCLNTYIQTINGTKMICIDNISYFFYSEESKNEHYAFIYSNDKLKFDMHLYSIDYGQDGYEYRIDLPNESYLIYSNEYDWDEDRDIIMGKYKDSDTPVFDALKAYGYPADYSYFSPDGTSEYKDCITFMNNSNSTKIFSLNIYNNGSYKYEAKINDYTGLEK